MADLGNFLLCARPRPHVRRGKVHDLHHLHSIFFNSGRVEREKCTICTICTRFFVQTSAGSSSRPRRSSISRTHQMEIS